MGRLRLSLGAALLFLGGAGTPLGAFDVAQPQVLPGDLTVHLHGQGGLLISIPQDTELLSVEVEGVDGAWAFLLLGPDNLAIYRFPEEGSFATLSVIPQAGAYAVYGISAAADWNLHLRSNRPASSIATAEELGGGIFPLRGLLDLPFALGPAESFRGNISMGNRGFVLMAHDFRYILPGPAAGAAVHRVGASPLASNCVPFVFYQHGYLTGGFGGGSAFIVDAGIHQLGIDTAFVGGSVAHSQRALALWVELMAQDPTPNSEGLAEILLAAYGQGNLLRPATEATGTSVVCADARAVVEETLAGIR